MKSCTKAILAVLCIMGAVVTVKTILEIIDNGRKIYYEVKGD